MLDYYRLKFQNLSIRGFRGIDELSIPRLGRVTLLAGTNSIGKTTVLDAVRVYAAFGRGRALSELLRDREEVIAATDEDGDSMLVPDWRALFYSREGSQGAHILLSSRSCGGSLSIQPSSSSGAQTTMFDETLEDRNAQVLRVEFGEKPHYYYVQVGPPYRASRTAKWQAHSGPFGGDEPPTAITCESLGPDLLDNEELSRLWDLAVLINDENLAEEALKLVFGNDVERVLLVGDETANARRHGRRPVVRIRGQNRAVPLRSLGDGALRLFGVALALANSRGGLLLIDEAENGLHYSLQAAFWNMVLRTAHENDVQVLATTHSSDCVKGFAIAASGFEDAEGVLIRLSRQYGDLRAVEYPEDELAIAAEQGIEVR
jgi:predicted ATPase